MLPETRIEGIQGQSAKYVHKSIGFCISQLELDMELCSENDERRNTYEEIFRQLNRAQLELRSLFV